MGVVTVGLPVKFMKETQKVYVEFFPAFLLVNVSDTCCTSNHRSHYGLLYAQCDFVFWQSNSVSGSIHIPYKLQYLLARFHCSLSLHNHLSFFLRGTQKDLVSFSSSMSCDAYLPLLCNSRRSCKCRSWISRVPEVDFCWSFAS